MKLYSIETVNCKLDGGAVFGVVPKVIWQKVYPADENNHCIWAMRCLLVVNDDKRILIDNGIGDKQDEKFFMHYFLNGNDTLKNSLNKYGFTEDEITDVVLTHLHFDHCGGGIKYNIEKTELELVFKNANYWVSKQQWEWAIKPNRKEKASFFKENILPIKEKGRLKLIEKDMELFPYFYIKLFYGHTEGLVVPLIKYKDKTIVYMSDLLPTTAHIPVAYIMSYDVRPLVTLKEKEQFLGEAAENEYILFLEHDGYNECCTVRNTEKGVRLKKTFKFSEVI